MRKKFRIVLPLLGLLIAVASLSLWSRPSTNFDPARWNDENLPAAMRLQMAEDVIRTHRLDGMTRADVIALLGDPPKTPYFKEYDLVYLLGPERVSWASIRNGWL